MDRINRLLSHEDFKKNIDRLNELEADRIYCRHGLPHLLDTARIACLLQYEQMEQHQTASFETISKELIYAAALLHDIGRVLQYEQNLPHETAGLFLAKKILTDCGFTENECELILTSIRFHKSKHNTTNCQNTDSDTLSSNAESLRYLLKKADKLSRNCFACPASDTCYWEESKKNKELLF